MRQVLKHIRAGLVHIVVLGYVDDGSGRKRRGARASPTCAAQAFYNLKCAWQRLELQIAANFGSRDWVLTLTYDDAHLPADKAAAKAVLAKFLQKLRRVWRKRGKELKYIYVTEGFHGKRSGGTFAEDGSLEDRRLHHHIVLNCSSPEELEEIKSLWIGGGYIRAEPVDVHYYRELAKYMTKEPMEFGRPQPGAQIYTPSRNLDKPIVEYEEIAFEGLTLAPPPGAVDYTPFAEVNPYGFAPCVGARYLLFPQTPKEAYSYSRGRGAP